MTRETHRAVDLFYQVRDIPYVLGLDGDPQKLQSEGKGNCTRKCLALAPELIEAGYDVLLGIVAFSWAELVPQFAHLLADPTDTHMILRVRPPRHGDWISIDPTWDRELAQCGFPISQWNGFSDTKLGVTPLRPFETKWLSTFRAAGIARETMSLFRGTMQTAHKPTPFNDAVNAWIGRG